MRLAERNPQPLSKLPHLSKIQSATMKLLPLLSTLAVAVLQASAADGPLFVTYEGKEGPGKGKHVVLISGDEEYRSEEAMPMLGKLLAEKHGFKATVLFTINPPGWTPREIEAFKKANKGATPPAPSDPDPRDGTIDPDESSHMPGGEAIDSADLIIMSLRFRSWPETDLKRFANYMAAGKPIIGLRTSTHAFSGIPKDSAYASWNWGNAGGFGRKILGETWVSHWGSHKSEATKGITEPGAEKDPLMRGVVDVFGTSDVYEAYPPADAKILIRGQVLKGMKPTDPPADYRKKRASDKQEQGVNDPMMPVAWSREVKNDAGKTIKTLCTTMGAATDLTSEGLRRLLVNATYAFTGLEVPEKADVTVGAEFQPTMYGFGGFKKGMKPSDFAPAK
jgi:hypothetical protein